jgi:hypothetical protein
MYQRQFQDRTFMKTLQNIFLAGALAAWPLTAPAMVNMVNLPERNSVQLTIYNSADLTLVKETRALTLRQGLNRLEFSWANTLIDPTSIEFRALTHADAVDVVDVSYPPRVANMLEWRIQSEIAGEVMVEIRYFTSGITWSADYVAEAAPQEDNMRLAGHVRVTNRSGEDYENAQVRLVVGIVRLVQPIAQLAQQWQRGNMTMPQAAPTMSMCEPEGLVAAKAFARRVLDAKDQDRSEVAGIAKEELSEYYLYTVDTRDTIPNGWSKRLPSFDAPQVRLASYYKFEKEVWGDQVVRFYRFTNSAASSLGREPLPDGAVHAFRLTGKDDALDYVGGASVKYIPVNEHVELDLGPDLEVRVRPVLMNWVKKDLAFDPNGRVKGWTTVETWEVEVQNCRDIPVTVDIRRNQSGDWSLETRAAYEKVDQNKLKFILPLPARSQQKFTYEVTTRHGSNATR